MIDRYPILRSLDPWHARIGYLGALAMVSTRSLDTTSALTARYHEFLYERIYKDDPRYEKLMERVPPSRRTELENRMLRPTEEDPSAVFTEVMPLEPEKPPSDWLISPQPKRPQPKLFMTDWLYVSEFWLYDVLMPSALGFLAREKIDRTIDFARWTGVLLPTMELSEIGYLIKHHLEKVQEQQKLPGVMFNPLNPNAHESLRLLYLYILLANDILYPFLILELIDLIDAGERPSTRDKKHGVLIRSTKRLLDTIGVITDPEDVPAVRDIEGFYDSVGKSQSTQENYLRPRLEILVDLGILKRKSEEVGKRSEFMWEVTSTTRALEKEIRGLTTAGRGIMTVLKQFLDRGYFASMARTLEINMVPVSDDKEILLWFTRAFKEIGREFGFTPGRTLALKACLMAWEKRRTIEVGNVFDTVYSAARSPVGRYLNFSGGSRFDREFLIRIDDELLSVLEGISPS